MNRTRLAQLTAVLGAAVLLVLAVAVTRTAPGPDSTIVAGPALDQLATQAPEEESPGGDGQDPGAGGDTPVMGPTATAPADPVAPGADGSSTETPAPGDADTGTASAGDTTEGPIGGSSAEDGPLPRVSQDPFAPGAAATPPPAADDPVSGPAPGTPGTAEETTPPPTTEPTTPAPAGTTTPDGATATPPRAPDPAPVSATPTPPVPPTEPAPRPEVETAQPQVHEVVPGDNLWDIVEAALGARASNAEVAVAVDQLYELNRDVIGDDPDLIFPGQVLELPAW